MTIPAADTASYTRQLQALLPAGAAWSREPGAVITMALSAIAAGLAHIHAEGGDLVDEADPRTTLDLLPDWERVTGLPDPCAVAAGIGETLPERRAAVVARLTATGGQSLGYFQALIAAMGYEATIEEFRPFVTGIDMCGWPLSGDHTVRFYWRVTITGARLTYFRTGESGAGDRLMTVARAQDLECLLNRLAPAHTTLIVGYTGV